jgi:hypothetical protein
MNERTYRQVFEQFLNDYWGAFHEVLEAQSVNPRMLAGSLFGDLTGAHARFAAAGKTLGADIDRLKQLWRVVASRRQETPDAPLSAREIMWARMQFEAIYDALAARGKIYPAASKRIHASARHGTPRTPLRPDAAA